MQRMGNVSQRDGKITKSHLCENKRQLDAFDERKEYARGRNGEKYNLSRYVAFIHYGTIVAGRTR